MAYPKRGPKADDIKIDEPYDDWVARGKKTNLSKNAGRTNDPDVTSTSKRRNHRSMQQREVDMMELAKLYLQGMSQAEISRRMNEDGKRPYSITPAMVGFDIRCLLRRWQESYLIDFNAAKAKELATIDELQNAYWEAWERSKSKKEVVETEKIEDSHTGAKSEQPYQKYSRGKVKKKEESSYGEAEFLRGIQWCIEKRCQILGINAPHEFKVNWREQAAQAGVDPGQVFNDMVAKYVSAASKPGADEQ